MIDWNKATQQWLHDFAPQGILATDAELNIRGWNRWLETHSGRRAADVMGRNLLEVYPELVERGLDRYYREALAGQVWILSQRLHRYLLPMPSAYRSGPELMTQSAHIAPLVQEERVIGAITVIEDVTERVWAEERMAHLNLVLRAIRKVNQLIARERDRDRLLQSTCDILTETRGYLHAWVALLDESSELVTAAEAGLGKDFAPLVEQLKRGELPPCGQRALGQSEVVITKDPLSACAGCPLSAKLDGLGAMTARLEHGGEVYGLLTVSIPPDLVVDEEEHTLLDEVAGDIAFALHSIELEEERQRAEEALRESEEHFHRIADTASEAIVSTDNRGNIVYWNQAAQAMFGYRADEAIGKPVTITIPERRRERFEDGLREIVSTGSTSFFGQTFEGDGLRKDGSEFPTEFSLATWKSKGARFFTAIVRDITERKQAEEALHRSLEETAHSQRTLLALSQAAQAVQRARTPVEVYQTVGDEVARMGYESVILTLRTEPFDYAQDRPQDEALTDDRAHLVFSHLTFDPAPVRAAEKLAGTSVQEFRLPVDGLLERIIAAGETTFWEPTADLMAEALPRALHPLAGKFAALLGLEQSIVAPLTIGGEAHGLLVVSGVGLTEADVPAVTAFANQAAIALENARAQEELRQSFEKLQRTLEGAVNVLVSTIEIKDPYTAGHQRQVTRLACAIAREMGLPQEEIGGLRMAGLIHDIGKISIPAEILSKPVQLNELEWSMIKAHPKIGYNILKTVDFPWLVAQIVLEHHERLDGSGYPQGLSSAGILMKARILAVADVVEAMASHRPYRPARGLDKALEEILQNRGILYDPEVVDVCLKLFAEKKFEFD